MIRYCAENYLSFHSIYPISVIYLTCMFCESTACLVHCMMLVFYLFESVK